MNRSKKANDNDNSEEQIIAYEAYVQTIERLQHFNRMQTTYRTFVSTWLLGTFFAIGYSLSSRENLPFAPLIVVALLCLASSAGIVLIWYMDLMMCERMIATALFEGLEYEKKIFLDTKDPSKLSCFSYFMGICPPKIAVLYRIFCYCFINDGHRSCFSFRKHRILAIPSDYCSDDCSLFYLLYIFCFKK